MTVGERYLVPGSIWEKGKSVNVITLNNCLDSGIMGLVLVACAATGEAARRVALHAAFGGFVLPLRFAALHDSHWRQRLRGRSRE